MALLTKAAMDGIKAYVQRTVAYARYKIGTTYYRVGLTEVSVDADGIVRISFMVEPPVTGAVTVNEVQLFDTSGQLWLSKAVSLDMTAVVEGYYYLVKLDIKETEK